jgi:hypothetical protein
MKMRHPNKSNSNIAQASLKAHVNPLSNYITQSVRTHKAKAGQLQNDLFGQTRAEQRLEVAHKLTLENQNMPFISDRTP